MIRTYLGPWQWDGEAWNAPTGCVGAVDLRPVPLQGIAGGEPGIGLFVLDSRLPGSDYTLLGAGAPGEVQVTAKHRAAWRSLAGFLPQGETLADLLWDHLTRGADPAGDASPKPLLPTLRGSAYWHELRLGGPLRNEPFQWGADAETTGRVRGMLRRQFRELFEEANADRLTDARQHLRVLDYWCDRLGVDDWREFVPSDLRGDVPGRLKHATTITDDFNRSDSSSLGSSSEGWSWTEVGGDFGIASNQLSVNATASDNVMRARAEFDLSSSDQYAQITMTVAGNSFSYFHPAVRFASAAATLYHGGVRGNSSPQCSIRKVVTGTTTNLVTGSTFASAPVLCKLTANGSALELFLAGASLLSVTDTSIASGLRTGVAARGSLTTDRADDFSAGDLAPSGVTYVRLETGTRGVARGVYTAFGLGG